jgi:drug/metabolite transporter (DMT)-like permease
MNMKNSIKKEGQKMKANVLYKAMPLILLIVLTIDFVASATTMDATTSLGAIFSEIWNKLETYILGIAMVFIGIMITAFAKSRESIPGYIIGIVLMVAGAFSVPGDIGNNVQKLIGADDWWPIGG